MNYTLTGFIAGCLTAAIIIIIVMEMIDRINEWRNTK